jgi:hypothetical protein
VLSELFATAIPKVKHNISHMLQLLYSLAWPKGSKLFNPNAQGRWTTW